ncbi:hypothetical protein PISMIDRAFT_16432 [Pisolithus microcarpus 441]|uniref:Uncharacterized protein n=1 Tax=Pisolithus microcarpus 441 TaxID=765257 RepID=A0A0C9YZP7_9AGAM|nr:hypothetical protein PISMIDRAFT_16432 [Pisolithus microcarpus 441]
MEDLEYDFVEEQVGGGGRANASPPPALTPTRLRTTIRATNRDGGLISKAQLCRNQQIVLPASGIEIRSPSASDNPFFATPEVRCASELFLGGHDPSGSLSFDDAVHSQLDTSCCDSLTGSGEHCDAARADLLETGSHDSPTPKRKLLGRERRGSKEYADDGHVCPATTGTEVSTTNFTLETVCSTVQVSLDAPPPTCSDVPSASGTVQVPLEDLPTRDVPSASGTVQVV